MDGIGPVEVAGASLQVTMNRIIEVRCENMTSPTNNRFPSGSGNRSSNPFLRPSTLIHSSRWSISRTHHLLLFQVVVSSLPLFAAIASWVRRCLRSLNAA